MASNICGICYEYDITLFDDLACGHLFCTVCLEKHIQQYIENNINEKIMCPYEDCRQTLTGRNITEIISNDSYLQTKYDRYIDNMVGTCIDAGLCPKCNKICKNHDHLNRFYCSRCEEYFCAECREEHDWDDGFCPNIREMEKHLDYVKETMDEYNIKYCPLCKMMLFKEEGCSAIRCKYCKIKFCWECLRTSYQVQCLRDHDCSGFDRFVSTNSDNEYYSDA